MRPVDDFPLDLLGRDFNDGAIRIMKDWFFKAKWFEKYDLIEFLSKVDAKFTYLKFRKIANSTLEKESAGYRLIDDNIVQITADEEITEIEEAINSSKKFKEV